MTVPDSDRPALCLHLFGPFDARLDSVPLARRQSRKSDWLLVLLTLRHGREVERAWLAGMLWPDRPTSSALALLRRELTDLRRALGSEACRLQSPTNRTLRLDLDGTAVDLLSFDQAIALGDTTSLDTAVALYRGPLLEGCAEEWVFQERQAREQAYLQALETLAEQALARGEPAEAERHLRRAVAADPLRESAQRALLQALAAGGNYAAVVQTYREFRERLHEELHTAPDPETTALFEQLRQEARHRAAAQPRPLTPSGHPVIRSSGHQPLAAIPEGENRLVTVLFADMCRFLETTHELEPEDTAALVSRLLEAMGAAIQQYEGQIDRFQGDGVLAVFGVPQAHEEDAERAIRAAVAIRTAAHDLGLEVRVGLDTGTVYAGTVGAAPHQEVTVIGPAVSLAARLQEQAQPGEVLVGETTYRQTRRAFMFTPRQVAVKGLHWPVVVYRVEGALARPEKNRGIEGLRAELIGREDELAKLQGALAAVEQGQGQVVTLIGEAGVGKSRLVAELRQGIRRWVSGVRDGSSTPTAQSPTPLWLEGRCLELEMTASYGPFLDVLRDFFGGYPDEDATPRGERITAALRALVVEGHLSEQGCEEIGPLLGHLLAVRFGNEWDRRLQNAGPEEIKHRTFYAIRDLLVSISRRQPLVLVFEDLHWADPFSLDLISLLMESVVTAPLLLLCVYRPEREHKCWHFGTIAARKCAGRCTELTLRELSPSQSRHLVERLLTIEGLPPPVKERILEKSGGNPFFLEEVIRALIDTGSIYRDGAVWRAREEIGAVSVPDTIQSVILSRIDRLEPGLKQVLQGAAIVGRLFRRRLLEHMLPAEPELERSLWALEEHALIYQERAVPEAEYSFQHVLTQETVYHSMLRRQREALHERVAASIEAVYHEALEAQYEGLAYHYGRSRNDAKAVEYLLKAGEKARRAYDNAAAIRCFREALERLEGGSLGETQREWRLAALKGLGQSYHASGEQWEAEEQFRQAIALGQEMGLPARELVRLYYWLSEAVEWSSREWVDRHGERKRLGEEGLKLLGEDTECVEAAMMNSLLGAWDRNARFLAHLPYCEELGPAYSQIIWSLHAKGDQAEAEKWVFSLTRQAEQHHDQRAFGDACWLLGRLRQERGDLTDAFPAYDQAIKTFARIGDVDREGKHSRFVGRLYLAHGRRSEALRLLRTSGMRGYVRWYWNFVWALGPLEEAFDDPEAFRSFCRRLREERPELRDPSFVQWYLEPTRPSGACSALIGDLRFGEESGESIEARLDEGRWTWVNPSGHSSLTGGGELEIRPEREADFWSVRRDAPRLLRPISGDFAIETVCGPVAAETPAVGGLLVWKDRDHYLRLEKAPSWRHEIAFEGRLADGHHHFGRGRLPGERVHLRLERCGRRFHALCSPDGQEWFTVGHVEFDVEDPVEIGLHALGVFGAPAYPAPGNGETPAIRFESLQIWGRRG